VAFKTKIKYFAACLEKDAAFYDVQNPNEMVSKITTEIQAM